MTLKTLFVILIFITFVLLSGCTSVPVTAPETPFPTSVATIAETISDTPVFTVGPTPTPAEDLDRCYWHNTTEYPTYCYDRMYWVRPTYSPVGSGYTAKIWKNDSCISLNRSSGYCNDWGDGSYVEIFMKNLTIVRNLSGVNVTEAISAASYYNRTFDLNVINGEDFDSFINIYWDGSYPGTKYDTKNFEPDPNVVIPVVNGTFNPEGF